MDSPIELRKIEKEIIEARALIIKSNNLANSLNTEVRSIAKRQSDYEKNMWWNSFVAYLLFTALIFAGSQFVYSVRQSAMKSDLTRIREEADAVREELKEARKDTGITAKTGEKELEELYRLISEKRREEAIASYESLNLSSLSFLERKLLEERIDHFRDDLSMAHYVKALDYLAARSYAEAIQEFTESLRLKDTSGHAKAARIHMAEALRMQGKPREAIAILQRVSEENLSPDLADDALWHLALSHEDAYQKDEAISVLRTLIRRHPESQFHRSARVKVNELRQQLWRDERSRN